MTTEEIAKALIVTAEIMTTELSPLAAAAMALELAHYPPSAVERALVRCQRELRGRLALVDVLQRIDDGHPGPQEAWACCQAARDEANTVVWTEQMATAFGVARQLLAEGDQVAARMAFLETYAEGLVEARQRRQVARWYVSLGHARDLRSCAVLEALASGRISAELALANVGDDPRVRDACRRLGGAQGGDALPAEGQGERLDRLAAAAVPRRLS